jgi:hypothetical protein
MNPTLLTIAAATVLVATPALGQSNLRAALSGRATTQVSLAPPRVEGQPAPTPQRITIDYGQPHARGRKVAGALEADLDTLWRLGANESTTLTTDLDLVIGGQAVPKGTYRLFARTTPGAWQLIVSADVTGDAMAPDASKQVARIPLKARALSQPLESLTMWLIPAADAAPRGELRIGWGTLEHFADWSVKP